MTSFKTLWNGTDKFKINILDKDTVQIEEKTIKYKDLFIGENIYNEMTRFSGSYHKSFTGSSILIRLQSDHEFKYTFICNEIYSFIARSEIIDFFSPIGNNLVPYPYAIDKEGHVYLFNEKVILKQMPKCEPYNFFYDYRLITTDYGFKIPKKPLIDYGIKKWIIGDEEYTLIYDVEPEKNYKRLTDNETLIMTIVYNNNFEKVFSKDEYVSFMKEIEQKNGIFSNICLSF